MNFTENKNKLSLENTVTIRGIAILCIMFYNFIRHLIGIDGNEDCWSDSNVITLISGLKSYISPLFAVSYWGWYGVPLFIFLSGYGLTMKYDNTDFCIPKFIYRHFKKIWLLMIPAFAAYLFLNSIVLGCQYPISLIIKQCTFTVNFLSSYIVPGIYWFFGLIIQFYLIFIVLRKLNTKWLWWLLSVSVLFDYCVLFLCTTEDMCFIRHNSIGWMPPFIFGVIYARNRYNLLSPKSAFLLISLFFISSLFKALHPLSSLLCIMSVLSVIKYIKFRWLYYIGTISSAIFAVHAVIRLGLYNAFSSWHLFLRIILFVICTFFAAYIYNWFMKYIKRVL